MVGVLAIPIRKRTGCFPGWGGGWGGGGGGLDKKWGRTQEEGGGGGVVSHRQSVCLSRQLSLDCE